MADPGEEYTFFKRWREETKEEEYSIYNDYWREHFIANGRLLTPQVDQSCQQALNMLKPAPFYVPKEGVTDLLWLNGKPPDEEVVVPKVEINEWSELFPEPEAVDAAKPDAPQSIRGLLGLSAGASDSEVESLKRRCLMKLYTKRRKNPPLSDSESRLLDALTSSK